MEGRAAAARRRNGATYRSKPSAAWHEQMEQDRASYVLPHHRELAWTASAELRGDRQPHWQYPLFHRAAHPSGARCGALSDWDQGERGRDGGHSAGARRLPRRVELHDPASEASQSKTGAKALM